MNDIKKTENVAKEITNPDKKFGGYTLEEIRYQRALVALQTEFCKNKINRNLKNIQHANPLSPSSSSSLTGKAGYMATKLLTGLNYLDYAMLGFSLFGSAKKIYSFFHKKKK